MLQQTQVRRVLEKYPEFLRRFPSFAALGRAPQADVVRAWRGLGYNNRAVRLHRLALAMRRLPRRRIPDDLDALLRLPGIGRYSAHAILCSVHRQRVPVVDINVRRFFSRLFWRMPSTDSLRPEEEIWRVARRMLPRREVYHWSQALMDLGALVCTSRAPRCDSCPVADLCRSRRTMERGNHRAARREPSWNGVPGRIFRGRIVEALREGREEVSVRTLRSLLTTDGRVPPDRWLSYVLAGLQKDGVIRLQGSGSLLRQRVVLA